MIPLRGGKRLIKKLINKYRLGNEYKEIKNKVENSSSSGGDDSNNNSGNLEYLYIKLNGTIPTGYMNALPAGYPLISKRMSYQYNQSIGAGQIVPITNYVTMGVLSDPFNGIYPQWLGNETFEADITYLYTGEDQTLRNFTGYFSSNNTKNYSILGLSDNGISIRHHGKTNSIGLKERYIDFEVISGTSSRDEAEENYNEYLGLIFEEITKEEYESQLTIK